MKSLILTGLCSCLALSLSGCAGEDKRPNVLLISIDQLRADHLSCYGYARPTSPALDRLAGEGVLFEQHMSSSSWTLPGHASLFTSVPDSIHGAFDTQMKLSEGQTTLAERFQRAGYSTAGFFSGPYMHPAFGMGQGFELYENCTSYKQRLDGAAVESWAMDKDVMRASHEDITNPIVYSAFQKWFGSREKKPFFAFLHLWDAHYDFIPPPPFDKQFDPDYTGPVTGRGFFSDPEIRADMPERDKQHLLALYDGEIAWTDSYLAKIRADLEAAGLLENTVIVVTSDHGTEFFEHGDKGHRKTLYDEVVHIPLVIRYPAALPQKQRVSAQTRSIDVGPTLLELAGIAPPPDIMGVSLLALARDPQANHPKRAVMELTSVGRNMRAVRSLQWKLIDDASAGKGYWFDLVTDKGELKPLSDFASEQGQKLENAYVGEVRKMEAHLAQFPPRHENSSVPKEVNKALSEFGYTGGDEPHKKQSTPPK